jgi:hypothetical protein
LKGLLGSGIGLTMAMWSVSGAAYDIATHALIGEKAYQRSVLNPTDANTVTSVLGFDRLDPLDPFTTSYFDNQATSDTPTQYTRFQQPQETSVFRALIDAGRISGVASVSDLQYRVDGWLMQGDVREDDNDLLIPFTSIYFTQDKRDPTMGRPIACGPAFLRPLLRSAFFVSGMWSLWVCAFTGVGHRHIAPAHSAR